MRGSLASRVFRGLPPHAAGQRIGLYGGSFNPAHSGHRHVSLFALRRLRLDRIWWLVTPANPLKDPAGLPSMEARIRRAAALAAHPLIWISGAENALGTRFTADFIRILRQQAPGARFVWLMGSDNLAQMHRWRRWRYIAANVAIAVVNRPGSLTAALTAPAARVLASHRVDDEDARLLPSMKPPAWAFLTGPRTAMSSTSLRGSEPTEPS